MTTPSASGIARFTVNGEILEALEGTPLLELLAARGVDVVRVAIERNREVVRRSDRAAVVVQDGDVFEVVAFVGGG